MVALDIVKFLVHFLCLPECYDDYKYILHLRFRNLGGGWLALDTTLDLFRRYGPNDGNPATDQAPEFVFNNVGGSLGGSTFELRTMENLGNLVPIV